MHSSSAAYPVTNNRYKNRKKWTSYDLWEISYFSVTIVDYLFYEYFSVSSCYIFFSLECHLFDWLLWITLEVLLACFLFSHFRLSLTLLCLWCSVTFKWWMVGEASPGCFFDNDRLCSNATMLCQLWCPKMEILLWHARYCLESSLSGGIWPWYSWGFMLSGSC